LTLDEAIECWQKAIEINPDHASAYHNMGGAFENKGDYNKAIKFYQKAIEIKPNLVNAHYFLGFVYHEIGNIDKAIECFQQAARLGDKESQDLLLDLGVSW